LANTDSAKKRIKVIAKRTARNKSIKTYTKTAVKKLLAAVASGDKAVGAAELTKTISTIDKAVTKGVIHKNTAARKKSRLAARVNKMA